MNIPTAKRDSLKEYYGTILNGTKDLKTNACCAAEGSPSPGIRQALRLIDDEILNRFYGCGSPLPPVLEGSVVLDLGCGTGRDAYIAAQLTGPEGLVIGVDMTDEQLAVARRHLDAQMRRFGYTRPNVEFREGYIEELKAIGIEDNSVDVVISNCVINLSPDKEAVFSEIFRVLKPGGELYFSDVFAGRRVPERLKNDPVLHGECLAGALYTEDFRRLLRKVGCLEARVVSRQPIALQEGEIEQKIGMVDFYSVTVRAFKLDSLEDICEDYGQSAVYLGTIPEHPHAFDLDDHHRFLKGKPMLVCGNTASMLSETRYAAHFKVLGDRSTHYGPFVCAPAVERPDGENVGSGGSCC